MIPNILENWVDEELSRLEIIVKIGGMKSQEMLLAGDVEMIFKEGKDSSIGKKEKRAYTQRLYLTDNLNYFGLFACCIAVYM